jgi:hypothetical protein
MKKSTTILFVISALVLMGVAFVPTVAQAQATRTWVSGVGDDANPCSRTAPCKTFAGAISKTAASGEISVLDPGGFGAVTITKSITINGDGTLAGILASLTNGVIVNVLNTDRVVLRNLSINGAGNGVNGIRFLNSGGKLTVDHCVISGFRSTATSQGIDVALTNSGQLTVLNSTIIDNANGIRLSTTSGFLLASVENSTIANNTSIGFESLLGNSFASIRGSAIINNGTDGIKATAATSQIILDDSAVSFNPTRGLNAATSGARIRISRNTINNNTNSIAIAAGAFVDSSADNYVAGNGGGVAPNGVYTKQ